MTYGKLATTFKVVTLSLRKESSGRYTCPSFLLFLLRTVAGAAAQADPDATHCRLTHSTLVSRSWVYLMKNLCKFTPRLNFTLLSAINYVF